MGNKKIGFILLLICCALYRLVTFSRPTPMESDYKITTESNKLDETKISNLVDVTIKNKDTWATSTTYGKPSVSNNEAFEFINPINLNSINELFDLIQKQEKNWTSTMEKLNLLQFDYLVDSLNRQNPTSIGENNVQRIFDKEIQAYLTFSNNRVQANQNFRDYLEKIGDEYTTDQFNVTRSKINFNEKVNIFLGSQCETNQLKN